MICGTQTWQIRTWCKHMISRPLTAASLDEDDFAQAVFNTVGGLANRVAERWGLKIVPLSAERLWPLATADGAEQRYTGPLLTQVWTSSSYLWKLNAAEDNRYYWMRVTKDFCGHIFYAWITKTPPDKVHESISTVRHANNMAVGITMSMCGQCAGQSLHLCFTLK